MKTLILTSFLVASYFAQAQFRTLPTADVRWAISYYGGFGDLYQTYYRPDPVSPDTVIGTITYTKLIDHYCDVTSSGAWYCYKGAYRSETNGKGYFVYPDSTNEYLLYDLDVNPGDTVFNVLIEDYGTDYLSYAVIDSVSAQKLGKITFRFVSSHFSEISFLGGSELYNQWIQLLENGL